MNRLVNPNTSQEKFDNKELIEAYNDPQRIGKWNLYALMARRANTNQNILDLLLDVVVSGEARRENAMGFIMHSWLPAIFLLKEGDEKVISMLCEKLRIWSPDELVEFRSYLKSDPDISKHLECLDRLS